MSMNIDEDQIEIIQEFVTESRDMIEQLEPAIIELGQNSDSETMNAIFRLFHSMKGSAGFLEFDHLTRVAHAAENLLDLIRNGEIELVPNHVTLLCGACDFAKEGLDMVESDYTDESMVAAADEISENLHQAIELAKNGETAEEKPESADLPDTPPATDTVADLSMDAFPEMEITDEMRLSFVQEGNELLQNAEQGLLAWGEHPDDKESIGDIFRHIHSFKGNCGFFGFSKIEALSHQMENILDRVKSGSQLAVENPADQLLATLDVLQQGVNNIADGKGDEIEDLDRHLADLNTLVAPLLGDFLVEEGVHQEAIAQAVETQKKPVGEILVQQGTASTDQVDKALKKQQQKIQQAKAEAKPAARTKHRRNARISGLNWGNSTI